MCKPVCRWNTVLNKTGIIGSWSESSSYILTRREFTLTRYLTRVLISGPRRFTKKLDWFNLSDKSLAQISLRMRSWAPVPNVAEGPFALVFDHRFDYTMYFNIAGICVYWDQGEAHRKRMKLLIKSFSIFPLSTVGGVGDGSYLYIRQSILCRYALVLELKRWYTGELK